MNALQGLRIGSLALLLSLLSGCLPVPVLPFGDTERSRQNITDTVPDFIVIGKSTRADILLVLGEPDQKMDLDARFLYFRETEEGGMAFLYGGGGRGGITGTPIAYSVLTVGFDGRGIVTDVKARKIIRRDFGPNISGEPSLW